MSASALIRPLVRGEPAKWHGLPPSPVELFDEGLGAPASITEAELGYHLAERREYAGDGRAVVVWARDRRAVMVEVAGRLPLALLEALEPPCATLPADILVADGSARERLFCSRGLVATVVRPHAGGEPRIVRLRGIAPIATPADFGPAYYRAFEDQIQWRAQ